MRLPLVLSFCSGLLALTGCSSPVSTAATTKQSKPQHAKIINFYGADSEVVTGHPITLCYGVEDALTVRLEPPDEELGLSRNRCFAVSPKQNTSYSIIAKGADGVEIRQSFLVRVLPKAEQAILIRHFDVLNAKGSLPPNICYQTVPGVQRLTLHPSIATVGPSETTQCIPVMVVKTTSFVLTAVDGRGRVDKMQVTVELPVQ